MHTGTWGGGGRQRASSIRFSCSISGTWSARRQVGRCLGQDPSPARGRSCWTLLARPVTRVPGKKHASPAVAAHPRACPGPPRARRVTAGAAGAAPQHRRERPCAPSGGAVGPSSLVCRWCYLRCRLNRRGAARPRRRHGVGMLVSAHLAAGARAPPAPGLWVHGCRDGGGTGAGLARLTRGSGAGRGCCVWLVHGPCRCAATSSCACARSPGPWRPVANRFVAGRRAAPGCQLAARVRHSSPPVRSVVGEGCCAERGVWCWQHYSRGRAPLAQPPAARRPEDSRGEVGDEQLGQWASVMLMYLISGPRWRLQCVERRRRRTLGRHTAGRERGCAQVKVGAHAFRA